MKAKLQSAYISVEKIVFPLTKILDNFKIKIILALIILWGTLAVGDLAEMFGL